MFKPNIFAKKVSSKETHTIYLLSHKIQLHPRKAFLPNLSIFYNATSRPKLHLVVYTVKSLSF